MTGGTPKLCGVERVRRLADVAQDDAAVERKADDAQNRVAAATAVPAAAVRKKLRRVVPFDEVMAVPLGWHYIPRPR
jgi:hypothetical protein